LLTYNNSFVFHRTIAHRTSAIGNPRRTAERDRISDISAVSCRCNYPSMFVRLPRGAAASEYTVTSFGTVIPTHQTAYVGESCKFCEILTLSLVVYSVLLQCPFMRIARRNRITARSGFRFFFNVDITWPGNRLYTTMRCSLLKRDFTGSIIGIGKAVAELPIMLCSSQPAR
jgi:hypothetical protein